MGVFDLERTLRPVGLERFLADYWEQAPLSIARDDPDDYARLLTAQDVEGLVAALDPGDASLELLGGEPERRGAAGGCDPPLERYRRGATIRLRGMQRRWAPLQALCRSLERALGVTALANLYWTPPTSQGLAAHWDGHDVLVLQIAGSKRWRVYDAPVALPADLPPTFAFERARPPLSPRSFRQWMAHPPAETFGPEAPAREIELRAGDLLYLPRGHGHEARTGETMSIHVTLGLYAVTWADLLCLAVTRAAQTDARFRRALPPGFAGAAEASPEGQAEFGALTEALCEAFRDPAAAAGAFAEMAERFVLGASKVETGQEEAASIGLHTPLRKRDGLLARLRTEPDSVTLFFSGGLMRGPGAIEAPLRHILATETFTPASLPGDLDEEGRVTLARRLVREGFLAVMSDPDPGTCTGEAPD